VTKAGSNPWHRIGEPPYIAPSLLASDFMRVGEMASEAIAAGAAVLHVDIMDGHFVPNLSMGPAFVQSARAFAGADSVTFHVEADCDPAEVIGLLRRRGLGVGITLRPGTPAEALRPFVEAVDMVLVMTVEPGYGGQEFMENQLPKIRLIRSWLGPDKRLEVDGGIEPDTAARCAEAGADVFVAGSAVFRGGDIAGAVKTLKDAARG